MAYSRCCCATSASRRSCCSAASGRGGSEAIAASPATAGTPPTFSSSSAACKAQCSRDGAAMQPSPRCSCHRPLCRAGAWLRCVCVASAQIVDPPCAGEGNARFLVDVGFGEPPLGPLRYSVGEGSEQVTAEGMCSRMVRLSRCGTQIPALERAPEGTWSAALAPPPLRSHTGRRGGAVCTTHSLGSMPSLPLLLLQYWPLCCAGAARRRHGPA